MSILGDKVQSGRRGGLLDCVLEVKTIVVDSLLSEIVRQASVYVED